ncbi:MAG: TolC family protein [Candidatus Wallbacteria bacterium]|nr:TolC family protein [Candidatus Wallbacteria bacterium]
MTLFLILLFPVLLRCGTLTELSDLALSRNLDYRMQVMNRHSRELENEFYRIGFRFAPNLSSGYSRASTFSSYYNSFTGVFDQLQSESENLSYSLSLDRTARDGTVFSLSRKTDSDMSDYSTGKYTDEFGLSLSHNLLGAQRGLGHVYSDPAEDSRLRDAENRTLQELMTLLCEKYSKSVEIGLRQATVRQLERMDADFAAKYGQRLIRQSEYQSVSLSLKQAELELAMAEETLITAGEKLALFICGPEGPLGAELDRCVRDLLEQCGKIGFQDAEMLFQDISCSWTGLLDTEDAYSRTQLELANAESELRGTLAATGNYYMRGQGENRSESVDMDGNRWQAGLTYTLPLDRKKIRVEMEKLRLSADLQKTALASLRQERKKTAVTLFRRLRDLELSLAIASANMEKTRIDLDDSELRFREKLIPSYEYIEKLESFTQASNMVLSRTIDLALFKLELYGMTGKSIRSLLG